MNIELNYILQMIRFVFGCGECPAYNEMISYEKVFNICQIHHIESLIASGLKKSSYKEKIDVSIYQEFMKCWKLDFIVDLQQKKAMNEIFACFDMAGVEYVPLKGIYLKQLYPNSELRSMSDLDVLYKKEQENDVDLIMEKLGYVCTDRDTHQHIFKKKPFINIEMHLNLVDDGSRFDDYYKNIFERLVRKDRSRYEMDYSDFYIFHIVHLAKHFMTGGCGIRFLIDLYVLKLKHFDSINWEYVDDEFKKIDLFDFNQHICELTTKIFNGEKIEGLYYESLLYMSNSGVYGKFENTNINKVSLSNVSKGKLWIETIFRPSKEIRRYYTYVDKHPFLLPVAWVHRLLRNAFKVKKTTYIVKSNFVDDDLVVARRKYLYNVGIKEDY